MIKIFNFVIIGSLGDFCTPKQTQKVNLKESFLTPREIKYSSSDSEDSVTELIPRQSDVIEVSSDEEEVMSDKSLAFLI